MNAKQVRVFFSKMEISLIFHTVMGMTSERTKIIVIGLDMQAHMI